MLAQDPVIRFFIHDWPKAIHGFQVQFWSLASPLIYPNPHATLLLVLAKLEVQGANPQVVHYQT